MSRVLELVEKMESVAWKLEYDLPYFPEASPSTKRKLSPQEQDHRVDQSFSAKTGAKQCPCPCLNCLNWGKTVRLPQQDQAKQGLTNTVLCHDKIHFDSKERLGCRGGHWRVLCVNCKYGN